MFAVYYKVKAGIENIRSLNLAVVKPTTVKVTMLPLYQQIRKIDMICFTKDLYVMQKEEFLTTCYMCDTDTWQRRSEVCL
jgi:hypothetical protein